jgi:hypothetical protein
MATIVALGGTKGSGKDVMARHVNTWATKKGMNVYPMAFAEPLIEHLAVIWGIRRTHMRTSGESKDTMLSGVMWDSLPTSIQDAYPTNLRFHDFEMTIRECMQIIGNDICKADMGENCWLDKTKDNVNTIIEADPDAFIIFSDLRFDYESKFVMQEGGVVIKLDSVRTTYDKHKSENSLTMYNYTVPAKGVYSEEETKSIVIRNVDWEMYLKDKGIK